MKIYSIKKQIKANSIVDAIKREKKADITDVWIEEKEEEEDAPSTGVHAIGFQYFDEEL